ncbi:transglutaminase-like cysteine peptidase [Polymorphum gilvum]|uniref:Putative transglutaminase-like cysteine peptidase protein n=1 Tax=Polymorphum gilvum (strain LMG 25793 / CGMCC 1.9160 / SL003B-26A1) TaxID=991905 RepID=F2IW66_POLGS|nr:transglutaminase-like cysteine peptidase [Polymorphum gilvum]ADZ71451.1 Putative transglutaminase-like cysteine peptidase protein [Polymorphum gilvum SL003B-26A1]
MRSKAVLFALALGLVVAPVQGAFAFGIGSGLGSVKRLVEPKFISDRGATLAPMGHVVFCSRNPEECRVRGVAVVKLTEARSNELRRVNAQINRQIRAVNDKGDGLGDTWSIAVTKGDCEDFALTKRRELIRLGWPSRALRIAVARTPWGEGHAVLVVRTSDGDLVLDNRTSRIVPWHKTDLTWLKIQSQANARQWRAI